MDLEEFKKRLNIEPRSEDPELLEARRESVPHAAAYRQAQDFEEKLEAALEMPPVVGSAEQIIARCLGESASARGRLPVWLGLAATVLLAAGAAAWLLPRGPAPADLEIRAAFVEHLANPEPALTSAATIGADRLQEAFALAGVDLSGDLGKVTYLSPCVIGGKKGLHLVITDEQGRKTTLMMIPGEQLAAAAEFELSGVSARLLPSPMGPFALFGHEHQDLGPLSRNLLKSTAPFQQTALL